MKIQIKNRYWGTVLFETDAGSLGRAILIAVAKGANLQGADLQGADLQGANLRDAKDLDRVVAESRILPEGDLIGWKKCCNGVIVKLKIPAKAKRSNAFGRKCRAEYAKVIEIFGGKIGVSSHDSRFIYKAGRTVRPNEPFSDDWTKECESGIHFFITRVEAENYVV